MPISFTQDRVGVHAKSVTDAMLLLDAIRGFDAEDLQTAESLARTSPAAYGELTKGALQGVRVGILTICSAPGLSLSPQTRKWQNRSPWLAAGAQRSIENVRTGLDLIAMMPTLRLNSFELRPSFDA